MKITLARVGFCVLSGLISMIGCSSSSPSDSPSTTTNNNNGTDGGVTKLPDGGTVPTNTTDGSTSSGAAAAAACASLAQAICDRTSACSSFALSAIFGDEGSCVTSETASCLATLGAPKTSATPDSETACATSFPQISCADFLAGNYGTACAIAPGGVASGGACGDSTQCATTFCAVSPTSNCGTCATPPAAGGACVNSDCPLGLSCPVGATKCQAPGTGQAGDKCTYNEDCDLAHGVGCNTNNGKCISLTIATSTCGINSIISQSSFAVCPASGTCSDPSGGTCSPAAAVGASCDATNGPACVPPAKCVSGTCTAPNPSACN